MRVQRKSEGKVWGPEPLPSRHTRESEFNRQKGSSTGWLPAADAEVPKNSQRLFMVTDPLRHRLRPSASPASSLPSAPPALPCPAPGPRVSVHSILSRPQIQSARKPSFPSSPPTPPTGLRSHQPGLFCNFPKFVHKERGGKLRRK